jgi:hypothetical protein
MSLIRESMELCSNNENEQEADNKRIKQENKKTGK